MTFNLLDLFAFAFIGFGVWRGRRRGLYIELPSTISALLFFITGCGLLKIMYRGLSEASALVGISVGIFTFAILVAASIWLVIKMRARIRVIAESRIDVRHRELGGGIAGGVRAFVWSSVAMILLAHGPVSFATRWMAKGSLLGSTLIQFVLPVYAKTHH